MEVVAMGNGLQECYRDATAIGSVTYRVRLGPADLFRLPPATPHVHVLSGTAWVTAGGEDFVLEVGQTVSFDPSRVATFISSLRHGPLLLEARGEIHSPPQRSIIAWWKRIARRIWITLRQARGTLL
jgi:hypothetical protein